MHERDASGLRCHGIDMDMSAEAEGARLLAGVEEEGLDEVSFSLQEISFSNFLHFQHEVVTVFSIEGVKRFPIGSRLTIEYSCCLVYAIFCAILGRG